MPAMILSRSEIAGLIPHSGAMCLLDTVQYWNASRIRCTAVSHRDPAHPLRDGDRLHAVTGIEYAAQAIAAHRGLRAEGGSGRRLGLLAAVRDVVVTRDRLDDIAGALIVEVETMLEQADRAMYRFAVSAGEQVIVSGRATVMAL
jgi:predicted hotdog family 3-hydroxylacyl-ACP dehydratase